MSVDLAAEGPSRTDARQSPLRAHAPSPVQWWAVLGAVFAAVQIYAFVTWFTRGDAHATTTGADPLLTATKVWAVTLQAVMILGAVVAVVWVTRKSLRERRLAFDAVLVIAWMSVYWLDPAANYVRPIYLYNSFLVNLGSWVNGIPGWSSPNVERLPEPFLFIGLSYIAFGMMMTLFTCGAMRLAKARWPGLGPVGLVAVAFVAMFAVDFGAELLFVRTQMYAYSGVVRAWSVWGGETYQFPLYESFFSAILFTAVGALRYFRDDKGRSVVERGVEQVRASTSVRATLRVLAAVGFVNLTLMLAYFVPMNVIALHVDETPEYPSYMLNGICGEGSQFACPGPNVPIPLRGSGVGVAPAT